MRKPWRTCRTCGKKIARVDPAPVLDNGLIQWRLLEMAPDAVVVWDNPVTGQRSLVCPRRHRASWLMIV
jgi:hypothetical protein